jgi:hypothetical protein
MWLNTPPPTPPLHLLVATSQSDCQKPATALLCSRKHPATVLNEDREKKLIGRRLKTMEKKPNFILQAEFAIILCGKFCL